MQRHSGKTARPGLIPSSSYLTNAAFIIRTHAYLNAKWKLVSTNHIHSLVDVVAGRHAVKLLTSDPLRCFRATLVSLHYRTALFCRDAATSCCCDLKHNKETLTSFCMHWLIVFTTQNEDNAEQRNTLQNTSGLLKLHCIEEWEEVQGLTG